MMTADEIKYFLRLKYARRWAFYEEFRPFTGYAGDVNSIDAVAVGLYGSDRKIIAFEIKVERGDFMKDVSVFMHKHRFALEFAHEFYYVCPWGLIDRIEVPDRVGLLYVDSGNRFRVQKQAVVQVRETVEFAYFQAFLQNSKRQVSYAEIPVKYMGRDWTQRDFMEEVNKKAKEEASRISDWEYEERVRNKLKEEEASVGRLDALFRDAGLAYPWKKDKEGATKELLKSVRAGRLVEDMKSKVKWSIESLQKALGVFDEEDKK